MPFDNGGSGFGSAFDFGSGCGFGVGFGFGLDWGFGLGFGSAQRRHRDALCRRQLQLRRHEGKTTARMTCHLSTKIDSGLRKDLWKRISKGQKPCDGAALGSRTPDLRITSAMYNANHGCYQGLRWI